ncbi:MAG: hypothetical protein QM489_01405 [Candidatus Izemoplasma sp.]
MKSDIAILVKELSKKNRGFKKWIRKIDPMVYGIVTHMDRITSTVTAYAPTRLTSEMVDVIFKVFNRKGWIKDNQIDPAKVSEIVSRYQEYSEEFLNYEQLLNKKLSSLKNDFVTKVAPYDKLENEETQYFREKILEFAMIIEHYRDLYIIILAHNHLMRNKVTNEWYKIWNLNLRILGEEDIIAANDEQLRIFISKNYPILRKKFLIK